MSTINASPGNRYNIAINVGWSPGSTFDISGAGGGPAPGPAGPDIFASGNDSENKQCD
jgi:hypothetical protein